MYFVQIPGLYRPSHKYNNTVGISIYWTSYINALINKHSVQSIARVFFALKLKVAAKPFCFGDVFNRAPRLKLFSNYL